MTWLLDLLDVEINREVGDNFQVFDLGNWMTLGAFHVIRVTVGKGRKVWSPKEEET